MSATRAFVLGLLTGLLLCGAVIVGLIWLGGLEDEQQDSRHEAERVIGGSR